MPGGPILLRIPAYFRCVVADMVPTPVSAAAITRLARKLKAGGTGWKKRGKAKYERLAAMHINELAPINAQLPAEILAEVFIHCVPQSCRDLNSDLSWIRVSQVCRHWREVALGCPELWANIIYSRPRWPQIMLERAKMAPLVIRAIHSRKMDIVMTPILLGNIYRLRVLDISAPDYVLEKLFGELVVEAPLLEFLSLSNQNPDSDTGGLWIPDNILRSSSPDLGRSREKTQSCIQKLEYLRLQSCAFPWDSTFYRGLTQLHLVDINDAQRPHLVGLLSVLLTTPQLQELSPSR